MKEWEGLSWISRPSLCLQGGATAPLARLIVFSSRQGSWSNVHDAGLSVAYDSTVSLGKEEDAQHVTCLKCENCEQVNQKIRDAHWQFHPFFMGPSL